MLDRARPFDSPAKPSDPGPHQYRVIPTCADTTPKQYRPTTKRLVAKRQAERHNGWRLLMQR